MDQELVGAEMLEIRAHLDRCPVCEAEYESLRETKRLLSSLALRIPPADLEAALRAEVERASHPVRRWMPSWLLAWRQGAATTPPLLRPRPLATAMLSLAGVFLATATLETPRPEGRQQSLRTAAAGVSPRYDGFYPSGALYPAYVGPHVVRPFSPPLSDPNPLMLSRYEYQSRYGGPRAASRTSSSAQPAYILTSYASSLR